MGLFASARIPVLAAAVLMPLAAQTPTADRETRVLELLRRLPARHMQLRATPLVETTNAHGCTIVAPSTLGMCGFGWLPAFDPKLARSMAVELCAIYGLHVTAQAPAPDGIAASLDCFDAEAGIGLKLRGVVEEKPVPAGGTWPTVVDEGGDTDLDVDEHKTLQAGNVRIHTADVSAFWPASSEDRFTATLAYLASVVRFLNDNTPGDDVDLTAMRATSSQTIPVAAPRSLLGMNVTPWPGGVGFTLEVKAANDVELPIVLKGVTDGKTGKATTPRSNQGRATILQWVGFDVERGAAMLLLRQKDKHGRVRDLASSNDGLLLVPGSFDAEKPFSLVLSLQPGQYRCDGALWLSLPAQ